MHCYFVLAGKPDIPIIYHVEHVREGKSFATRTVQARQRGQPIFTVTLSFMRELDKGQKVVSHALCLPDVPGPKEDDSEAMRTNHGPFESQHIESGDSMSCRIPTSKHLDLMVLMTDDSLSPHLKRTRMWIKTRGKISGGHEAHLNALAYMSDSFFIGTVARAHKLWRNFVPKAPPSVTGQKVAEVKSPIEIEIEKEMNEDMAKRIREMNGGTDDNKEKRNEIAMMVSLDHVIYFHLPREFRADEWLLSEMDTPWAGDGRGLVMQRIWTRDGRLIASCVQEVSRVPGVLPVCVNGPLIATSGLGAVEAGCKEQIVMGYSTMFTYMYHFRMALFVLYHIEYCTRISPSGERVLDYFWSIPLSHCSSYSIVTRSFSNKQRFHTCVCSSDNGL